MRPMPERYDCIVIGSGPGGYVAAILIPAGTLFWKLVKAMARMQIPEQPEP